MKKGRLEVIVGCMSSGKTDDLIRRLRRAVIAKKKVILFKPRIDVRTDEVTVASRDGTKYEAVAVDSGSPDEILSIVGYSYQVVGIEEIQFFHKSIIRIINELIDRGIRVIVVGLETDFRGEPFGCVPELMAIADAVIKFKAVCVQCGSVQAIRTQRLFNGKPAPYDSPLIQVGGDELYEARCRNCHEVPREREELAKEEKEEATACVESAQPSE